MRINKSEKSEMELVTKLEKKNNDLRRKVNKEKIWGVFSKFGEWGEIA